MSGQVDAVVLLQWGLPIISILGNAGAWIYAWQARKHAAQTGDLKALELRIQALELQQSIQSEQLRHIPTTTQLNDLAGGLAELRGDIKALTATITPLEKTVGLIDVHLRSLGKPTAA